MSKDGKSGNKPGGKVFKLPNLGEHCMSPFWDEKSHHLIFVDTDRTFICEMDIKNKKTIRYVDVEIEGKKVPLTFAIPYAHDRQQMVLNDKKCVRMFNIEKKETTAKITLEPELPKNIIAVGKCDGEGRLFVATMAEKKGDRKNEGSLYSIDWELKIEKHADKLMYPNGIAWSKDDSVLYFTDSQKADKKEPGFIYAMDYDLKSGKSSNKRVLMDVMEEQKKSELHNLGSPFGLTVDSEDRLWVAMYGAAMTVCIDPKSAHVLTTVYVEDFVNMVDVCFGGDKYGTLFITTSHRDLGAEYDKQHPLGYLAGGFIEYPCQCLNHEEYRNTKGLPPKTWSSKKKVAIK